MSEGSGDWYMRARGRVLGPFTRTQLESMRDRGQLSQFHEVSQDKRMWVSASTVEGLFGSNPASLPIREDFGPANAQPSTAPRQDWFYTERENTHGPTSGEQILALLRNGRIRADTPIWREGLPCWIALQDVPEFAHLLVTTMGPIGAPSPPIAHGIKPGAAASTRPHKSRLLIFSAATISLILLATVAFLLVYMYRKGELRFLGMVLNHDPVSGATYVASHMSNEIPQATGLVVSGLTITDLKTGEVVELPGSRGTSFAVNPKGYLLTNRHVVEEYVKLTRADAKIADLEKTKSWRVKPNLWVYFAKERYDATVLYSSGKFDMAVLKVDRIGPYFRLTSRPSITQGTRVYALGFPAASSQILSVEGAIQRATRHVSENVESVLDESDFRYSITDGIISLVRNEAGSEYIQHSAEISGGNSGGPLIYDDGSVLGINTLVTFDEKKPGVGVKYYALTINQALVELLRKVPELLLD
jgi:S1-C subfamily serine protease